MDAMMGFSLERILISRHIKSLARASPPGESMRSTTAEMFCPKETSNIQQGMLQTSRSQPHIC